MCTFQPVLSLFQATGRLRDIKLRLCCLHGAATCCRADVNTKHHRINLRGEPAWQEKEVQRRLATVACLVICTLIRTWRAKAEWSCGKSVERHEAQSQAFPEAPASLSQNEAIVPVRRTTRRTNRAGRYIARAALCRVVVGANRAEAMGRGPERTFWSNLSTGRGRFTCL